MAPKFVMSVLDALKPSNKPGKTLLALNAIGMAAAAVTDTFAAAIDKDTKAEDKKFLIPAGVATGVAKLGLYYGMTTKIIDKFENNVAKDVLGKMDDKTLETNVKNFAQKSIDKARAGFLGIGKKSEEHIKGMQESFFKDGAITEVAKEHFKKSFKAGFGVLGSFVGAAIGSAILTPIIRDVSAYFVQKHMEKKKPEATREDIEPFLNIVGARNLTQRQPISMKSYMAQTKSGMKI